MFQSRDRRPLGAAGHDSRAPARSAQYRLVLLTIMLLLVLVLMQQAARPQMWGWLWNMGNPNAQRPGTEFDSRKTPSSINAVPDSFISVPADRAADESTLQPDAADLSVDPKRFANVKDDTYFRRAEAPAWFYLYDRLRSTPLETLDEIGQGKPVSYLQLYRQTDSYRGKLVTLTGIVRRAFQVPTVKNDLGIDSHWQLWVFEDDEASGPVVVYTLQMPEGFPQGVDLQEDVRLTGYAYKRWAYPGQGGLMVAPVVLGKTAHWYPSVDRQVVSPVSWPQIWLAIAVLIPVSIIIARLLLRVSPQRMNTRMKRVVTTDTTTDFDFLNQLENEDE